MWLCCGILEMVVVLYILEIGMLCLFIDNFNLFV